jgi:cytochrome c peroxidase
MKLHSLSFAGLVATLATATAAAQAWETLPTVAPAPADNPTTAARVELGKMLYHDPRFSETGTISCASCHNLMEGGDDHRPTSIGVHGMKGGRNAPTVFNAAFLSAQFWDGRAPTLEAQAKGPIVNPVEMGMKDLGSAIDRIRAIPGYAPYFTTAFGPGDTININNAAMAIAAYERTQITPGSPYDRYVHGDKSALTAEQQRGMKAFVQTGCQACHSGVVLAGPPLPMGTPFLQKFPLSTDNPYVAKYDLLADKGRFNTTKDPADEYVWRVPQLRNLVYTAPYLHNGSVKTLPEMARLMAKVQLGTDLAEAQAADIAAFLASLTGEFPKETMPRLPPTPGDLLQ